MRSAARPRPDGGSPAGGAARRHQGSGVQPHGHGTDRRAHLRRAMQRLGCGYEQLAPLNPRLVYLALKGYLAGPYEHRPALDEVVQFQTGLAYMTGPPGQPLRAGAAILMTTHMTGAIVTGAEPPPMPARRGAWAIYQVFKTASDGQLFIGVTSDQQWVRFVEEFGLQSLAADPRLATNAMR